MYSRYYQANRYRLLNRTPGAIVSPDDIKTWDLRIIMTAIIYHDNASLEHDAILKITPLDGFEPIVDSAKNSRNFRPTLYDFIAHRAADFFENDESGLIQPAEHFEIDRADYFQPAAAFAKLDIPAKDSLSLKYLALLILQDLVAFHLKDADPLALIDVDLERLKFVHQNSVVAEKDSLMIDALKQLEDKYKDHPGSADISYELALEYYTEGQLYNPLEPDGHRWDRKRAEEICERVVKQFPGTDGATNCMVLQGQITEKLISLTTADASIPDHPFLGFLTFKNIPEIYFRIILTDPETDRNMKQLRNEELIGKYKSMPVIQEWSLKLPEEEDFQHHSAQVPFPELPVGYYVILAGSDKNFSIQNDPVAYSSLWVTSISYISQRADDGTFNYYVLNRETGAPMKGVDVHTFAREYDYASRSYILKDLNGYVTGEDGNFSVPSTPGKNFNFYLSFTYNNDRYISDNNFYQYSLKKKERQNRLLSFSRTVLFTVQARRSISRGSSLRKKEKIIL